MAQMRGTSPPIFGSEALAQASQLQQGTTKPDDPPPVKLTQYVSFETAYKQLMERWEDPHYSGIVTTDAGGVTKYGISENSHPSLDIRSLTLVQAKSITEADYWNYGAWDISKLPFNSLNQRLANKLFQMGFNIGVGTVIQLSNIFIMTIQNANIMPKAGDPLFTTYLNDPEKKQLLFMLSAAQVSRYAKDYHMISRIPHSLMDRGTTID
jgi:hypothetical protein